MMRCLIVVPSLTRAGAETQAVNLANGLASRGHNVHLCVFERNLDQRLRIASNVTFHHVQRRAKYDLGFARDIARIIDDERVQVVQGILMFGIFVAWLAIQRSRSKPALVAAIHTTVNRGIKQEIQDRVLYRPILKRLPAIVFVCEFQRDYWIRKYPELARNSHVVYNGIDPSRLDRAAFQAEAGRLRATLAVPESAFVFSCIAGFRREKGHQLLIQAFARLRADAFLLLAGEGAERAALEDTVRTAGLSDRVRFLGSVPDVRPLIVASNATVLASTAVETFSMAMLESMALGVPLIASRIGGLPEAIVHHETGLLFPIGDIEALAAGMKEMTEVPAAVGTMGQAGAMKVRSSFTMDQMIDGSERVLESVI